MHRETSKFQQSVLTLVSQVSSLGTRDNNIIYITPMFKTNTFILIVDTLKEAITKRLKAYKTVCTSIGVGVGKFLRVQKNFARISQTCPESFRATLCANISINTDHEHLVLEWPPKKGLHVILHTLGANFSKSNNVGWHFCAFLGIFSGSLSRFSSILRTFSQILAGFSGICLDFRQIKLWGCACTFYTPATYTTVHMVGNLRILMKLQ